VIADDNGVVFEVIPETVEQFTGLRDKNGKEIYEGDIVRINTHFWSLVSDDFEYRYDDERGHALYVVKWDERYCKFFIAFEKCTKIEPKCKILNVHSHHKVIGNIHDNPELINHKETF